ncbi:MAG TPA: cation diffusion facilitator family transporter [Bacilli bacterium]|nr:cation diffusion facilitator family transporter [Bacilli bacterium]
MQNRASMLAAWVSVISNFLLTILKIVVGLLYNSQVLIADGVHNAADVVASVAATTSMRISNRPADEDHPYGHGKAEVIAAGIVAVIMALAAMLIAYDSVKVLLNPDHSEVHLLALVAAVISLIWKQLLYLYTMRIGRKTKSKGLMATAYDHLADVYASLAAVAGIGIGLLGTHYDIPYSEYGDPIAGIIVSVLVLKLAGEMGVDAVHVLMEKAVGQEKLDEYAMLVISVPNVKRIDRLRAREHGHYILVDVRVGVPGYITVQEGHDIARDIKQAIMDKHEDVQEVLVHLNPWYEEDDNDFVVD